MNSRSQASRALRVVEDFDHTWLTFERSKEFISSGKVKTKPIITRRLPISEVMKAFDLVQKKEAIKVILQP